MVVGLEVGVRGGAVVEMEVEERIGAEVRGDAEVRVGLVVWMEVEVRIEVGLALGGGIFVWVHPAQRMNTPARHSMSRIADTRFMGE